MRRLLIVVAVVAALGSLLAFGMLRDPSRRDTIASPLLGKEMPAFTMPLFERYRPEYGESFAFPSDAGKPMVINFWASWCAPCKDEAPMLEQAWQEYGDEVMLVGVNTQDSQRQAAEAFLSDYNLSFPNGTDGGSRIGIDYGLFGLPETFFIRADGTLNYKHAGPLTAEVLDTQIQALLE